MVDFKTRKIFVLGLDYTEIAARVATRNLTQ
jgi:hypothetical protein